MNKNVSVHFIHFIQIFDFLFDCHVKPVAMTKMLPFENPLASRFHWTIPLASRFCWTIGSGKTLMRLIFPVEILYSLLCDGI
jgi:hypothetical protein